ncbi:MAG: hypothetical protein Q7T18_08055 [Sedimentisphaerales bacterium]|nr:hypothetical protein [Sedimentisphaerales bacterium]
MNIEKQLEKLAARARGEQAPHINVAHKVLGAISYQAARYGATSERQLMWVAVVSSAIAAMIVVAAVAAYYNVLDPITEVSETISWVIQ